MNIELSQEDLSLLKALLDKERGVIGVEIHHCRTHDYKDFLKQSEKQIEALLERINAALGE